MRIPALIEQQKHIFGTYTAMALKNIQTVLDHIQKVTNLPNIVYEEKKVDEKYLKLTALVIACVLLMVVIVFVILLNVIITFVLNSFCNLFCINFCKANCMKSSTLLFSNEW